jgi:hypothetical protein
MAAHWPGHEYECGRGTNTATAAPLFDCCVCGRGTNMNMAMVASFDCCVCGRGTNVNTAAAAFDCCVYGRGMNLVAAAVTSVDCCVHGRSTNTNTAAVASADYCVRHSPYYLIVAQSSLQIQLGHNYEYSHII